MPQLADTPPGRFRGIFVTVPGEHRVTITKQVMQGMTDAGLPTEDFRIEWLVPEHYSKPETSGLTATVAPDNREHSFDLSSR